MKIVKRYIQGYNYIYVNEDELRNECYKEMLEFAPSGASEEIKRAMGETLFQIVTSPKI